MPVSQRHAEMESSIPARCVMMEVLLMAMDVALTASPMSAAAMALSIQS
jgi:hypothetical protein